MSISSVGRRARLIIVGGFAVLLLAVPATVSADTTGGPPSIAPASSRDATISLHSLSVTGKVVVNATIDVVCQPFQSYDWTTGQTYETTDGFIDGASVTILQAQGRTVDSGTSDWRGNAVCDGSTVNTYNVAVAGSPSPWRNGSAVIGATVYVADTASFSDSDSASTGPLAVRLTVR